MGRPNRCVPVVPAGLVVTNMHIFSPYVSYVYSDMHMPTYVICIILGWAGQIPRHMNVATTLVKMAGALR